MAMDAVGENFGGNGTAALAGNLGSAARRPRLRNILGFCLFEAAFYFAYRYAMSFSHVCASPFWFPDSVLLCALLLNRPGRWWLFVLAPLPIRLLAAVPPDLPLWFLTTTFAIDSAKGVITAAALRRLIRNPLRLETAQEFALYCLFAVLLIPAACAFAGAAARHLLGHDYWPAWEQWFTGNALANLIVTPAILYWVVGAKDRLQLPSRKRCIEGGLVAAGLLLTGHLAFNIGSVRIGLAETRCYAPVPFLFWAAIRFGMVGASGAVMIVAFVAVKAALEGRGTFSGLSPGDTALALQHFLLLRAAPLYLVAVLIEQRKRSDRSLRESEERFRYMADTAPVMIWMSGPDKLCEFFNKVWLSFTGRKLEQELGNGWSEGVHSDDIRHCLEVYHSAFDGRQPFEMDYRLRRHDGEFRWVLDKGVPRYAPNGDFIGYIGSAIDITDRKRVEEADRDLAHVQRLAVVGELTAMIAHEVNQPLGAILSNADAAEMLLESPNPPLPVISQILADIRKNDLRATETIRRIRALLRKREMQMEPLDLNETVSDVLRLVAGDAARRRIQIRRELARELPPALGDRVHLQQVLLNLMVNAMDSLNGNPKGARLITVQTRLNGDDHLEVAVADCGCGIAPDRLLRVFDSFLTTKKEGMGLGLSIARSIIEAHKGRMWAENNSSGGATFHFAVRLGKNGTGQQTAINE